MATSVQDTIKQDQAAIKAEQDQLAKARAATDEAIVTSRTQEAAQVEAQNKFAADEARVNQQRIADLSLAQAEYEAEKNRQKDLTLSTVQPLLDKEKATNQALLEDTRAKQELAENKTVIDNEVAIAQQNMAFASMGMTFTPSAINATRRLTSEASLAIAKLKSGNAYEYANLAKDMSKVEIAHQLSVNKIIADSNESILAKREATRKGITDIQSNIILTEKEKVDKIAKLKMDYATFRANTEGQTLVQIRDSNKEVERRLNDITTKLDKDKADAKLELISLVKN